LLTCITYGLYMDMLMGHHIALDEQTAIAERIAKINGAKKLAV